MLLSVATMTRARFLFALLAFIAYGAPAEAPVVMYATSWCAYCAKARAYFARTGTPYVEHDKMSGFSEQRLDSLLARAAR